jgi:hypothetical protein
VEFPIVFAPYIDSEDKINVDNAILKTYIDV